MAPWFSESMNQWIFQPHPPKVLRSPEFFCDFYVKTSSCYIPEISKTILCVFFLTELALESRAHFANQFFSKVLRTLIFLIVWNANQALAVLSTLCPQLSRIEARNRGKETLLLRPYYRDPRSQITRKYTGFRTRKCFHPWIHTLLDSFTSQLLDNGWLTWWCECECSPSVTRRRSN